MRKKRGGKFKGSGIGEEENPNFLKQREEGEIENTNFNLFSVTVCDRNSANRGKQHSRNGGTRK